MDPKHVYLCLDGPGNWCLAFGGGGAVGVGEVRGREALARVDHRLRHALARLREDQLPIGFNA